MNELTHYTSGLLGQVFLKDENNDVWAKMWDMDTVTAKKRAALIVEAVNTCTALRAELEAVKAQRDELIHRANIAIGQSTNINNIYYDVSIAAMDALEMKVDELMKIRDTEPQS